jgi:hypothetical protein
LIAKPDKFGHLRAPVLLLGDAAAKALEGMTEIEFTLEVKVPPPPVAPPAPAAGAAAGGAAPAVVPAVNPPKVPEATRNIQVVIGTDL